MGMYRTGDRIETEATDMCEVHPDVRAVQCLVGEVDSFGAEFINQCQECIDTSDGNGADIHGDCEICHENNVPVRQEQDPEEGFAGRRYDVCGNCSFT